MQKTSHPLALLCEEAIQAKSLERIKAIVEGLFPLYPQEVRDEAIDMSLSTSLLYADGPLKSYLQSFGAINENGAIRYLTHLAENGVENLDKQIFAEAVRKLGKYKIKAVIKLFLGDLGEHKRLSSKESLKKAENDKSELILAVLNQCSASIDIQEIDTLSFLSRVNNLVIYPNNMAFKELDKYLDSLPWQLRHEVDRAMNKATIKKTHGSDYKLSVDDLPLIDNGSLKKPELYLATLENKPDESFSGFKIPVLIDVGEQSSLRTSEALQDPLIELNDRVGIKEDITLKINTAKISFVDTQGHPPSFNLSSKTSLWMGISIPEGKKIAFYDADELSGLRIGKIDPERFSNAEKLCRSIWSSPSLGYTDEILSGQESKITVPEIVYLFEHDQVFLEEFKRSRFNTRENIQRIANVFALDNYKVPSKNSGSFLKDFDYPNHMVLALFKCFGVLPQGKIVLTERGQIETLQGGYKATDTFGFFPAIPMAALDGTLLAEDWDKLVSMGAYIGLAEAPDGPAQAIKRAGIRSGHPMLAAFLRTMDFEELKSLAKTPGEWDSLYNAFPDRVADTLPHMSMAAKRKVINQDFSFE